MLVELRADGCQTMAPPSIHPSGERVQWERFEAPGELLTEDLEAAVARVGAAALLARCWPQTGSRQSAALALAGGLARAGWTAGAIENFIRAVATAAGDDEINMRCNVAERSADRIKDGDKATGWPTLVNALGENGKAVVGRVREWLGLHDKTPAAGAATKKKVRPLPDYRPFPLDALPGPARDYCAEVAAATGVDSALAAVPCLAALAGVIGNSRRLQVKRSSWYEPAVAWALSVGESGVVKSPPAELAIKPIQDISQELSEEYQLAEDAYQAELEAWEATKKSERGSKPKPPTPRQVLAGITTIEAMIELHADNPHGLLLYQDELDGWLNGFGLYHKGGKAAGEVPVWLSFHGAREARVNRKTGRKFIYASRAALSLCGTIQPNTLKRSLTPEFRTCGLAARLLFAMPPKRRKIWTEADLDPATVGRYSTLIRGLYNLDFTTDANNRPLPVLLHFTPDARRNFIRFFGEWAEKQFNAQGDLAAAFSKLEGYAIRFALIHQCASQVAAGCDDLLDDAPVTADSLDAGITLARWFADESERVYQMLGESEEEEDSRRLVDHIRGHGGRTTVRGLQRANGTKYPTSTDAQTALEDLVQAGAGRWEAPPATPHGGNSARWFVLHPTPDTSDTCSQQPAPEGDEPPEAAPDTTVAPPTRPAANPANTGGIRTNCAQVSEVSGVGRGEPPQTTAGAPPEWEAADQGVVSEPPPAPADDDGDRGTAEWVSEHGPEGPHHPAADGTGSRPSTRAACYETYETGRGPCARSAKACSSSPAPTA